jgi:hypothetical protein
MANNNDLSEITEDLALMVTCIPAIRLHTFETTPTTTPWHSVPPIRHLEYEFPPEWSWGEMQTGEELTPPPFELTFFFLSFIYNRPRVQVVTLCSYESSRSLLLLSFISTCCSLSSHSLIAVFSSAASSMP